MRAHLDPRRAGRGAAAGLLSGAAAVRAGQLVAAITGAYGSPVVAVGQLQIDVTPPALKNFAINAFGSHDKLVLVSGILVVLALYAAALGILAMRRLGYGLAGPAVFAIIGVVAAATRPGGGAQAPIKTESRIDVPNGSTPLTAGPTRVAGVAWAQHKGITAGEVRADRGPWQQARLATVPGIDPGGSGCGSGTPPPDTTSSRPAPPTTPATPRPRPRHRPSRTAPPATPPSR